MEERLSYISQIGRKTDYANLMEFDRLDALFPAFQSSTRYQPSSLETERGSHAWGSSLMLRSYLLVYNATGDERYIRKSIGLIEQVLLAVDSMNATIDYTGKSSPAWSSGSPYTTRSVTLPLGGLGNEIHIRAKSASYIQVFGHASNFSLKFLDEKFQVVAEFSDLSLQINSSNFVKTIVNSYGWRQPLPAITFSGTVDKECSVPNGTFPLIENFYIAAIETSQICTSILEFCLIVMNNPGLSKFRSTVDRYAAAVSAALACHDGEYRPVGRRHGYVIPSGAPYDFEGTDAPLNHSMSMARCFLQLFKLYSENKFLERSTEILRLFRDSITIKDTSFGESYVWPYFAKDGINYRGYTYDDDISSWRTSRIPNQRTEDMSHAVISVETVLLASEMNIIFEAKDLRRFANTFLASIGSTEQLPYTLFNYVDGTGGQGKYDHVAGRWSLLSHVDSRVWKLGRRIMNFHQPRVNHGSVLYAAALLSTQRPH